MKNDKKKSPEAIKLGKLGRKAMVKKTTKAMRLKWAKMGGLANKKQWTKIKSILNKYDIK